MHIIIVAQDYRFAKLILPVNVVQCKHKAINFVLNGWLVHGV